MIFVQQCWTISTGSTIPNFLPRCNSSFTNIRVALNGNSSKWAPICAGVPHGSVMGPLLFLVNINDLVENVNYDVKMFADNTSPFSVVKDERRSAADELNADLDRVRLWVWQWKMQFNVNKIEEVVW